MRKYIQHPVQRTRTGHTANATHNKIIIISGCRDNLCATSVIHCAQDAKHFAHTHTHSLCAYVTIYCILNSQKDKYMNGRSLVMRSYKTKAHTHITLFAFDLSNISFNLIFPRTPLPLLYRNNRSFRMLCT